MSKDWNILKLLVYIKIALQNDWTHYTLISQAYFATSLSIQSKIIMIFSKNFVNLLGAFHCCLNFISLISGKVDQCTF